MQGFLVRPGDLLHPVAESTVVAACPQAFYAPLSTSVPECPPVLSKAQAKMLRAAF